MENQNKTNKNNNKVIILLLIIIIILGVIVVKGVMDENKTIVEEVDKEINNSGETTIEDSINDEMTEAEAINILKNSYNDVIRQLFNQFIPYCGDLNDDYESITLPSPLESKAYKSATFSTFEELDTYVKMYITEELLSTTGYYRTSTSTNDDGEEIIYQNYYEEEDGLYCNFWNKGGDLSRESFQIDESKYEVTSMDSESISGKITAVYNVNGSSSDKNTIYIEVKLVYEDGYWKLNDYEEVD